MGNRNTLNPFYPTIHLTLDNTIFSMQANFLVIILHFKTCENQTMA